MSLSLFICDCLLKYMRFFCRTPYYVSSIYYYYIDITFLLNLIIKIVNPKFSGQIIKNWLMGSIEKNQNNAFDNMLKSIAQALVVTNSIKIPQSHYWIRVILNRILVMRVSVSIRFSPLLSTFFFMFFKTSIKIKMLFILLNIFYSWSLDDIC